MNERHAGLGRGLLLAGMTLGVVGLLPRPVALDLLALILAVTAGVYVGFAVLGGGRGAILLEAAGLAAFLGFALAGLWLDYRWLAAGFLLHIVWDYAHHPRVIPTQTVAWYPPACLAYDGIVGAFILYYWR